jgi:hypothetical protein
MPESSNRFRRWFFIAASLLCGLAAGCSGSKQPPVYPVRGQVLLNGKPLAQAIVTFHHQGSGPEAPAPSAQTDSEGRYTLTSYQNGDGAPEGDYAVSLVCFRTRELRKGSDEDTARNIVPVRYANAATSRLTAKVAAGKNELPPLQVKTP